MKSEKYYFRVAKKLGYFFLIIFLLIVAGGVYKGFMEEHKDSNASRNEAKKY